MTRPLARALGPLALPVLAALLAQPLAAQITVGPAGSGAQFEQIGEAVDAAAPGATILVSAGEYEAFLVDKPLTIVAFGADAVVVHPDVVGERNAIHVAGIPAGGVVRLAGLTVSTPVATPWPRVLLEASTGVILMVDVEARGTDFVSSGASSDATLLIDGCDAVILESCDVFGSNPPPSQPLLNGALGARIVDSSVWIDSSELRGSNGGSQFGNGGPGAPALLATDAYVHLSRTRVQGGGGGVFWAFEPLLTYGFAGSPGAELLRSELVVAGGEGNLLVGGFGPTVSEQDWYPGGPAVRLNDDATLRVASDATLASGEDDDPGPSTPPVADPGSGTTVVLEPDPRPTLAFVPSSVRPGDPLELRANGSPGAVQLVYLAVLPSAPDALGASGDLLIDPGPALFLAPIPLDGAGLGSLAASVPSDPALIGIGVVAQAGQTGAGAGLRLTNPAALFLRP